MIGKEEGRREKDKEKGLGLAIGRPLKKNLGLYKIPLYKNFVVKIFISRIEQVRVLNFVFALWSSKMPF